jgi:phosphomannomutase
MSKKLFGTSGIRGDIAKKVTPDLALGLGRALGTYLEGKGTVGVGIDYRTSNYMLRNAFISGVVSTGTDVIDLEIAPMPTVASHSTMDSISVSVIITASHNPPGDNGFKFFNDGREFIRSEEVFLEDRVAKGDFRVEEWDKVGQVSTWDIRQTYLKRVKDFILNRGDVSSGMKVLLDLANGAACNYTPHIMRELGFSVTTVNSHPDGHFPGRPAEPSPRNLGDTMKMTADSDFSVALCHDGDGDRLAVIDEDGNFVDQNRVIALFARDEVERRGGGLVVVSIDTSSVIDELVNSAGGQVVRGPLGSLQEILSERRDEVVFASEPWKPIFMELGMWMDGITGAVRAAQMIESNGNGSTIELMKTVPEYPMLRDFIPCPDEVKPCFSSNIRKFLESEILGIEQVLDVDGIRVECTDGSYVLVRVSGTEPKARVYIGARSEQALQKLEGIARNAMQQTIDECKK